VVLESDLETDQNQRQHNYFYRQQQNSIELPFVRAFSLNQKKYVYVDIEDCLEHSFDRTAVDRLVLPPKMEALLRKIFATNVELFFSDLIAGKSGGMVVLANGGTGVGKTLTAEAFAEFTERPLYTMEMGELGTSLKAVEENLQRIFMRATRWNAVLLFDEADIFMHKRDDNLERSAIVGVFLRLLDYYKGLLFLTSNRAEVIDDAFKSRITLKLDYPELDAASRKLIWTTMLTLAKFDCEHINLDKVAEEKLNGRQIRNMTRMLKVLHPDDTPKTEDVLQVCEFSCS